MSSACVTCDCRSQDVAGIIHISSQISAKSDAVPQTYTSCFPSFDISLHSASSQHITLYRVMYTSSQGASGPSGNAGLPSALGQLVSGNHSTPQQISPEQSMSREIRRLIVRLLLDVFDFRANKRRFKHSVEKLRSQHEVRLPFRRPSTRLTCLKESSVTKEEFDALLKSLDRVGLGTNSGDAIHRPQLTRSDVLPVSVNSSPLRRIIH